MMTYVAANFQMSQPSPISLNHHPSLDEMCTRSNNEPHSSRNKHDLRVDVEMAASSSRLLHDEWNSVSESSYNTLTCTDLCKLMRAFNDMEHFDRQYQDSSISRDRDRVAEKYHISSRDYSTHLENTASVFSKLLNKAVSASLSGVHQEFSGLQAIRTDVTSNKLMNTLTQRMMSDVTTSVRELSSRIDGVCHEVSLCSQSLATRDSKICELESTLEKLRLELKK